MKQCLHILVSGKVYKTGYRYFLKQQATLLHLTGYVIYTEQKSVEILAAGTPENLDIFILKCRMGNATSNVSEVHIQACSEFQFSNFDVLEDPPPIKHRNPPKKQYL